MPTSPSPGILGRLEVGSSGGRANPAQEPSKRERITIKIAAENAVASLMHTIRGGSSFGCCQFADRKAIARRNGRTEVTEVTEVMKGRELR
jgi:hypothetical protein